MHSSSLLAYVLALACLFVKYTCTITLQGRRRFQARVFRWPEDAVAYDGKSSPSAEDPWVERAQHLLRNDSESQPYFLFAGGLWVFLGVPNWLAFLAFASYVASRFVHGWLMLWPSQPARTRVFGIGQAILLGIVVDCVRRALLGVA